MTGRTVVVVRGTDDVIYDVWETAVGSSARGTWRKSIDFTDPAVTDPTLAALTDSGGPSFLVAFRNANGSTRVYGRNATPTGMKAATLPLPPR